MAARHLASLLLLLAAALGSPVLANNQQQNSGSLNTSFIQEFLTLNDRDISQAMMREIFGPVAWETITGDPGLALKSDPDVPEEGRPEVTNDTTDGGIVGLLSSVLVLACMILTVLFISWGAVAGTLSGAMEGREAGRRYNLLWTPLRSVWAFGLLLPVVGGYCLGQVIVMKAIVLSIGIANAGYNLVLDHFFAGKPTIPMSVPHADATAAAVFQIEACQAGLINRDGSPLIEKVVVEDDSSLSLIRGVVTGQTSIGDYWDNLEAGELTDLHGSILNTLTFGYFPAYDRKLLIQSVNYSGVRGSGYGDGICGTTTIKQKITSKKGSTTDIAPTEQTGIDLFEGNKLALENLHARMRAVVAEIATVALKQTSADLPSDAGGGSTGAVGGDPLGELRGAYDNYRMAVQLYRQEMLRNTGAAVAYLTTAQTQRFIDNVPVEDARQEIRDSGWVMLGGIYQNMQAQNRSISELIDSSGVSTSTPNYEALMKRSIYMEQYLTAILDGTAKISQYAAVDPEAAFDRGATRQFVSNYGNVTMHPNMFTAAGDGLTDLLGVNTVTNSIVSYLTDEGDFVYGLSKVGHVCWNLGIATLAAMGLGGADAPEKLGDTGDLIKSAASYGVVFKLIGIGTNILSALSGLLFALVVPLLLIGFFLAFYLPAVPMILWAINVVGWMIQCVKSVFAVPVWAAAHSIPEGEGIAGTHAKQGYMLILGVVLRPILLVTGIMVGAVVLAVTGWFVRMYVPIMFASLDTTDLPGLFGFLALLAIFAGLAVNLALKCWSLSHELADEILEWIGGRAGNIGDEAGNNRVQQIVTGVVSTQGAKYMTEGVAGAAKGVAAGRAAGVGKPGGDDPKPGGPGKPSASDQSKYAT